MSFFNNILSAGFILWLSVSPGRPDRLLSFADRLLSEGQVNEAITEYKRYVFFNSDEPGNAAGYAYYQMGLAYRHQGRWDEAVAALLKSIQAESLEETRDERRIALGVTEIACGRYDQADFTLLKVEMFSPFGEAKKRAAFFRGICNLYTAKWSEAREAFRNYSSGDNLEMRDLGKKVDSLLVQASKKGLKSPRLAKTLSTFLPGLGQIYASDWAGGLNAFVLNAATAYLLVHDLVRLEIQDAVFNSVFLFERFYSGNRQRAEEAAKKYNQNLSRQMAAEILKILERN